jgi:hypothetical protein
MTISVRAHWAARASVALEEAGITDYSVIINKVGVYMNLRYADWLRFYNKQPFHKQPEVRASRVGQDRLTEVALRFKHGEVEYATYAPSVDYRKLRIPEGGLSLGRWNPEHDPTPWAVETEQ